jgi:hypothetical protein
MSAGSRVSHVWPPHGKSAGRMLESGCYILRSVRQDTGANPYRQFGSVSAPGKAEGGALHPSPGVRSDHRLHGLRPTGVEISP